MGLPDGLTSENQTLGALWEGWEVTEVRQSCTAVSHAIFNWAPSVDSVNSPAFAARHFANF